MTFVQFTINFPNFRMVQIKAETFTVAASQETPSANFSSGQMEMSHQPVVVVVAWAIITNNNKVGVVGVVVLATSLKVRVSIL